MADDDLAWVGDPHTVREVFAAMPLMMVCYEGPEHIVIAENQALRAMYGREVLGMPLAEAMPEFATQAIFEIFDRALKSGQVQVGREFRIEIEHEASGELRESFVDFTAAPLPGEHGRPTRILTYGLDVTERVRQREAAKAKVAEVQQRYEAAVDVITELQAALMPATVPVLPYADVAARYLVAAHDQVAGGDWFDVLPFDDGRVALVVGDVVGHGVAASAAMGQLRAVLNDQLHEGGDIAASLARLGRLASRTPAMFGATVCIAVLDPAVGTVRYATCGHPAPLVVAPDGATRWLAATGGTPLGTGTAAPVFQATVEPEEILVLYSDGLVERPGVSLAEGQSAFARVAGDAAANRVLTNASPSAAERVCRLSVELLTRTGYHDDVTMLAVQRRSAAPPDLSFTGSTDDVGVADAVATLRAWLDGLRLSNDVVLKLELAVNEAIANVAEHAYPAGEPGLLNISGRLGGDGVAEIDIADEGRWRGVEGDVTRNRGLAMMERLVDDMTVNADRSERPGTSVALRQRMTREALIGSAPMRPPGGAERSRIFATEQYGDDGTVTLKVMGAVDASAAARFNADVTEAAHGGTMPLTIDLTAVTLLSSKGVRALYVVKEQLAAHQHALTLIAAPHSPAALVLDLVGLPYSPGSSSTDVTR